MANYLCVFGLNKNFSIDINIDRKEDVICNLAYIRVIIFNILLFIIENSNDQKMKTISIKREHVKYEYKKGNYDRLIFSFTDPRPALSYETLKLFFQHFNYHFFLRRNPIETYNLVNFGFLVPYLISETQYNLNDNKIRQFRIETKGYNVEISIILFFQEMTDELNNIEEKKFQVYEKNETINEIRLILSKRFYKKKENIQQESLLDDGKDDNLIKANEEYNLNEDKNFVNDLRARKYVIGDHNFEKIIPDKQKNCISSNKKVKFKSRLAKKKIRVDPLLKSIDFTKTEYRKYEIPRFLVIEDKSFIENSIFRIILRSGNECNIDCASDSKIVLDKYNEIFKQKMQFDFIFIDICQNSLKGYDALIKIREIENKNGIHTKIIGIQNKKNEKAMINKKMNLELFDKVIDKSIKEFNELIYS
jgi:CheY-like chemotaxis protein